MINTNIITRNIKKTNNLINLINTYTSNFFNVYKKNHKIDLNFEITSKDIAHFSVNIEGVVDGSKIKSSIRGDDLIPILEIVLRNFRDKTKEMNLL